MSVSSVQLEIQSGFRALSNGVPTMAEQHARSALTTSPQEPTAHLLLALSLGQQGRALEALPVFERLTQLQPAVPEHWSNLGNCLCELGQEADAWPALQQAWQRGDRSVAVEIALARSEAARANPRVALQHVERALQQHAGDPELHLLRARILVALDENEAAQQVIAALRDARWGEAIRIDAGYLLLHLALYEDSAATFAAILQDTPASIGARIGLATAMERVNQLGEAQFERDRLPAVDEIDSESLRAALRQLDARLMARAGRHGDAVAQFRRVLDGTISDPALRCNLQFELGRSLDAIGEVDAAMTALDSAHANRKAQVSAAHPAMNRDDGLLAVLEHEVPEFRPQSFEGFEDGENDPVFVVGFPRSGTTLLEQLLDAHPALASFDEQPFVQRLLSRVAAEPPGYPAALPLLDAPRRRILRAQYFADVRKVRPDLAQRRAVDKNPLYLSRLPLISALFPRGKVILALRHPCDVVLSCYMQNFRAPAFALTFASLRSTADMYDRVMRHYFGFADRLGLPVHVLRYEDLVGDVEGRGRQIFDFLDLDWRDELLQFTERARLKRSISTPSYSQVVQPVNRRAVGRWQAYGAYFDGQVLDLLSPWIEQFGYGESLR